VMTFFASNLIILISLTLLFIFCWQIRQVLKKPPPSNEATDATRPPADARPGTDDPDR
jgi:hypothetical protein